MKVLEGQKMAAPELGRYESDQVPFGQALEEMSEEDRNKRLELDRIQRSYQDVQTSHPLLLELQKKVQDEMEKTRDPVMEEKAKKARQEYLRQKKYKRMMLKEFN